MVFRQSTSALARLRAVLAYANPKLWAVICVGGGFVVTALLGALPPILIGKIIDALGKKHLSVVFTEFWIYAGVSIATTCVAGVISYVSAYLREGITKNLRLALIAKIHRAQFPKLTEMSFGEIGNRIAGDVVAISHELEYSLLPIIQNVFSLLASIVAMIALDRVIGSIVVALMLLGVVPMRLAAKPLADNRREQGAQSDLLYTTLLETCTVSAAALLRNSNAAQREIHWMDEISQKMRSINLRATVLQTMLAVGSSMLTFLGPLAIIAIGSALLVHGAISIGVIVSLLMFQTRLYRPFGALANLQPQILGMGVSAERLLNIFDLPDEVSGDQDFANGDIAFENVSVVRGEAELISQLSCKISVGVHTAIVGPSGAGKSTMLSLIVRLFDPTHGKVTLNSTNLRDLKLPALRAAIAIVSQDGLIFDVSLLENITYTNPSVASDAVNRVLRICRLEELIRSLPGGVQTVLGQRGFRLSGGERQRICLARALLQFPDILVLDEALSGVDIEMEAAILSDIRKQFQGRTIIAVTHRLSSIMDFDEIMVIENAHCILQGQDQELRDRSGWYRATAPQRRQTTLELA